MHRSPGATALQPWRHGAIFRSRFTESSVSDLRRSRLPYDRHETSKPTDRTLERCAGLVIDQDASGKAQYIVGCTPRKSYRAAPFHRASKRAHMHLADLTS